ncbi:hypothetical protein H4R19_004230 [Coemansia spiralis]|nr:hypothetical protein H4R19_004230 [Coemansia spiralis]
MATLSMPSTKPTGAEKHRAFLPRPTSTSSGSSGSSAAADGAEPAAAGVAAKLAEGLGSLSSMPTPRNTFLTPPSGLVIPGCAPPPPPPAKRPLPPPPLAERPLAPYDDTYALLGLRESGPRSRSAAIAQMRRLAATGPGSGRSGRPPIASVPLALAAPIGDLGEVEDALVAIIARRQIPNRIHVHCPPASGAGSSLASEPAAASPGRNTNGHSRSRSGARRPRPSAAATATDAADEWQSVRSQASAVSSPRAPSFASGSGSTPYVELNGHMERLAACISRLQVASADAHAARAAGMRTAGSVPSLQSHYAHARKGSVASAHSSLPAHFDPNHRRPSLARLSPVSETPVADQQLPERRLTTHSRSSSHLSVISGMSTESRRRIRVGEILTSAHYPSLFGSPVADPPASASAGPRRSPSALSQGAPSIHGESIYSHDSSDARSHRSPPLHHQELAAAAAAGYDPHGATPPASSSSRPPSKSGSAVSAAGPLSITVRDITPASRIALWLHLHTTVGPPRASLWRRRHWQRRFFIFAGNVIYLFKSSAPTATAMAVVRLNPSTIVCVNDSFNNRSWVIEITQPVAAAAAAAAADGQDQLPQQSQPQQSWYLQADTRSEMINLLKQLKGAVGELQVQPDIERREEERMRDRRRKQRASAKTKSDICPWEVDEFSDAGSDTHEDTAAARSSSQPPPPTAATSGFRIADDELFSDEGGDDDERPLAGTRTNLETYSLGSGGGAAAVGGARPGRLHIGDYTGTGGIAEWGAHRMQVPYIPAPLSAGVLQAKARSLSADPTGIAGRRRPSLADVLAPPSSAGPDAGVGTTRSSPQIPRSMSLSPTAGVAVRASVLVKADASALIDQMFASARDDNSAANQTTTGSIGRNCLSIVCEED